MYHAPGMCPCSAPLGAALHTRTLLMAEVTLQTEPLLVQVVDTDAWLLVRDGGWHLEELRYPQRTEGMDPLAGGLEHWHVGTPEVAA